METKIRPNVVYSITAPSYFSFKASEVMRFTNPWVTHPNKYAWSVLSIKEKIQYYLYGLLQKRLMRGAHYFITQTETCALGIKRITGEPDSHVKVVKNVLPAVFKSLENTPFRDDDCINIACVGAATTHKNFDIIPDVLKYLKDYGLEKVRIHVTLPSDEPTLGRVNRKLQRYGLSYMLVNHGRLTQKELGEMYRRCQFCFLPTLLEVFSASTLEAMYYELPIVATNFPFNREVLADSCLYYEPKNAKAAAEQIRRLVEDTALQEELRLKMQKQFTQYSDYDAHFKSIVDFLIQVGLGRK
jgi:glycosyltransferase involved in cell wall biosynthesis